MKILSGRLDRGYELHKSEYDKKAIEVLESGWYILGNELSSFEEEFASHMGSKFCIGVGSGLSALELGMRALGISGGDEVIVPANTYIASVMGITMNGATPIFVEPNDYYNIDPTEIENAITERTKAIVVVHLYGQACEMDKIMTIAHKYKLKVIEDCAQAHDATFGNKKIGTFGDIGCYSFYPTKNLGAFGDAGAITTDDVKLYEKLKMLRNYGSQIKYQFEEVGENSRLDEMQAGLLRIRLSHLDELTKERQEIASYYNSYITNSNIVKPIVKEGATSVWHQYVVRVKDRKKFMDYLEKNDIHVMIHYPIPPHLSNAYKYLGYKIGDYPVTEELANEIVSLPIYNGMKIDEYKYVVEVINGYK